MGYTEMLRDGTAGPVSQEQGRLLETVHRSGQRLVALVEDHLTLSRIEAGTFTLEKTSVDLRMVLNRCREAMDSMLDGRGLPVRFEAPDHPGLVVGDFPQLERVVLNLLSNALKFTEDNGYVECCLGVTDGFAEIVVTDTGVGIPEDEQPQLFTGSSGAASRRSTPSRAPAWASPSSSRSCEGTEVRCRSAPRRTSAQRCA